MRSCDHWKWSIESPITSQAYIKNSQVSAFGPSCFSRSWCITFSENRPQLQNIFFSSQTTTHIPHEPQTEPLEKPATSCSTRPRVHSLLYPPWTQLLPSYICKKKKRKKALKAQPNRSWGQHFSWCLAPLLPWGVDKLSCLLFHFLCNSLPLTSPTTLTITL